MLKIKIEPLKLEHVRDFLQWGNHENPLFSMYNFEEDEAGIEDWYRWKTSGLGKKYFGILADDFALGYMGLKNKNTLLQRAYLGIILDANFVGQGIGKRALEWLLRYGFEKMNLKRIDLEVLPWNERAKSLYTSLGFVKIGYKIRVITFDNSKFEPHMLDDYVDNIKRWNRQYLIKVDYMILTRDRWES